MEGYLKSSICSICRINFNINKFDTTSKPLFNLISSHIYFTSKRFDCDNKYANNFVYDGYSLFPFNIIIKL